LHYTKLVEGHKAFYTGENRAKNYDKYMIEQKNWKVWQTSVVSKTEIEKLFQFIHSWDLFFRGDPYVFQSIYQKIYSLLEELRNERTEDGDFSNASLKEKVQNVFDWVANCTAIERYESTDASNTAHYSAEFLCYVG